MSACLSEEELLAFAVGSLRASRLAEAHLHLDQCETCQYLLNEAAHALATATTIPLSEAEDVGWNTMFRPGMLVGKRYLIRQFIARGGMGEVYEAFDRELQERVALKTVNSTASDSPRATHLLKGEVQTARRVSHPNVCRIYDFGTHVMSKTGVPISFLTMEFVEGETLGQRIRLVGALPVPEAQKVARQLLHGLSAAHDAHVLHRDFKSDNVMLRAEADDESWPLIMDFGLARAFDRESKHGSSSSNSMLVGTLSNIAPEQLEGKLHSKASDVYAFGVVWFEMLTGELPFEPSSSPAVAVLERVRRAAPAPSSRNPLVPRNLDALVLGCLRRSPKERYRTAGEVLAALDAVERGTRPARTKRKLFPAAVAFGLGGMAAYWALRAQPIGPAPVEAGSTFASASAAPQNATAFAPTMSSEPPASEPPASEPPASEPPASEPPASEPPASEPPASEPSTGLPVKQNPSARVAASARSRSSGSTPVAAPATPAASLPLAPPAKVPSPQGPPWEPFPGNKTSDPPDAGHPT